jgi:DNA polymerase-3 subunit beta
MKLSCTQENLNKGLGIVGRIARTQATLPVLSNVLLKTEKGRLKISATDLEIGASCFIGSKIEKEGAITVPARLLIDYVTMNNDKKIDLSAEENTLSLESEKYKAKIKGIGASEFPLIPEVKEKPLFSFNPSQLKEAISQVLIAPSLDETKPVLSGICLKFLGKEIKMVATDSFRLAEKTLFLEKETEKKEAVIPSKTLSEISRILSLANPSSVSVAISSNQVLFVLDDIQIVSRIIEGNFPDYEPIIPQTTETIATMDAFDFQNSLKLANLFAKDAGSNVKLKLEKDKLIISGVSSLFGENISTIPSATEGPEAEVAFNAKFLLDALSVISSPRIVLGVSGKLNPGIIKPFGKKDYLYLIMPLRTEE